MSGGSPGVIGVSKHHAAPERASLKQGAASLTYFPLPQATLEGDVHQQEVSWEMAPKPLRVSPTPPPSGRCPRCPSPNLPPVPVPIPISLLRRTPKRRRDVVAVTSPTNTSSAEPPAPSRAGSEPKPDFQIFEDKVVRDRAVLSRLRHFTEYRIDIHACNHAAHTVGCSAATFVFARTMPERRSRRAACGVGARAAPPAR